MSRRIAILLWMTALTLVAKAGLSALYNISYLNVSTGLGNNFVDDIFEDSNGFMWLSTHNGGLVRYDGYSFMNLGLSSEGIQLRSNASRNVCEDQHKRLWAAFEEGFQVIDLRTLQPVTPHFQNSKIAEAYSSLYRKSSIRVYCDTKGGVWLVLRGLLVHVGFGEDGEIAELTQMPLATSFQDVALRDVYGDGSVVMNYQGRMCRVLVRNGKFVVRPLSNVPSDVNGRFVTDILNYHGAIWLATTNGLYNTRSAHNFYRNTGDEDGLQHNYVSSLAVSPDGRLLIGTLRGVDILDDKAGNIEHWNSDTRVNPLSSNFVNCLYVNGNQIWVGTETSGIVKLTPRQLNVTNFVHHDAENSLSPNAVNTMYAEPNGTLWVGTVEGGLNRMVRGGDGFSHYTTANSALPHNSVSALEADGSGRLWIGTWGGGVAYIELKNPSHVVRWQADAGHQPLLTFIGALEYDKINHCLWIGANEGLFYYNMYTRELEEPFPDCTALKGNIGSIITRDGKLLMGNLSGMVEVDLRSRRNGRDAFVYTIHRYKLDKPSSGVFDKITSICPFGVK